MRYDFSTKSNKEIEDILIDGDDLNTIYRLDIFLERQKTNLFLILHKEKIDQKRAEIKASLSWTENMHTICKSRQHDLKEDNNKFNWKFRIAAEKILPEGLYNQIAENAK